MPTVSVIVPTYNRGDVISRAIESVLQQTYQDYELIIVDDGSTDDTSEIVANCDDPRVKYIYQQNQGANAARNEGISHAEGEYISFLDSDDTLHSEHLERVVERFREAKPDTGAVYTGFRILENDHIVKLSKAKRKASFEDIKKGNNIGGFSCITVRAKVFDDLGMLDERLPASQDVDLYIRLLQEYDILGVEEILLDYYIRGDQISSTKNIQTKATAHKIIRNKHRDVIDQDKIAEQHYQLGVMYFKQKKWKNSRDLLKKAIKNNPRDIRYFARYIEVMFKSIKYDIFNERE